MKRPAAEPLSSVWYDKTVAPSALKPGETLGRYVLEEILGRGAMGEVWKAFDPIRESPVVIKLLPLLLLGNDRELCRIQDSFRKVNALQHQHICPVYDLQTDQRVGHYLVMKYLEGETLAIYRYRLCQESGSFDSRRVPDLLKPIASALDYAHSENIIHRDVKPQNIMVRPDGSNPQLVDFGLADEIRLTTSRLTQGCVDISGTYPYMAPEQWRGQQQDGRTDQYALAVVAYELISGHPPFESPDMQIMRLCVLNDEPGEIGGLSHQANAALKQALAKEPSQRFASCTQFIERLEAAFEGTAEPLSGSPDSWPGELPSMTSFDDIPPSFQTRETKSRVGQFSGLALAAVAILAAALYFGPELLRQPAGPSGLSPAVAANTASSTATTPSTNQAAATAPTSTSATNTSPAAATVAGSSPTPVAASNHSPPPQKPDTAQIARVEQAKQVAENAQRDASRNSAEQYAATLWSEAEQLYRQGNEEFATVRLDAASQSYQQAASRYYEAINLARQVVHISRNITPLRQELTRLENEAQSYEAEKFAAPQYNQARQAAQSAEAHLSQRDYIAAASQIEQARTSYLAAIGTARAMQKMNMAQASFEDAVEGLEQEHLTRYGGTAWHEAMQQIDQSRQANDLQKLEAAYLEAGRLVPDIRKTILEEEVRQMAAGGEHQRVLSLLWPSWDTLTQPMQELFLASAGESATWWRMKAEEMVSDSDLSPHQQALVYWTLSETARQSNDSANQARLLRLAQEAAADIQEPRQAMEASMALALEVARLDDSKALDDLITRVDIKINSINADILPHKVRSDVNWQKYLLPIRCAAIYWRKGDKKSADYWGRQAFSRQISSSGFYYDLPLFQAFMVFAESGDVHSLRRIPHIQEGRINVYQLRGGREYASLLGPVIFQADNRNQINGNSSYELIAQAELALAGARAGDDRLFEVHYGLASTMINQFRDDRGAFLKSSIHGRLAMAEAHRGEFERALARIRDSVEHDFPRGEAALHLGRLQLASRDGSGLNGLAGAEQTLQAFASHPLAAPLAAEIATARAQEDLVEAIRWARSLPEEHLRIAALAGLSAPSAAP